MSNENFRDWAKEPDQGELFRAYEQLAIAPAEALERLKGLAERGSIMSMLYLADAYRNGMGIKVDLVQAQSWYRSAANCGSIPASYELGRVLYDLKSYAESKAAFEVGEAHKYAPSINMLGMMYLQGVGVERSISKARDLLEQASGLGNVFAKRNLAVLLMRGADGPLGFLRGVGLFLVALKDIVTIVPNDRFSDRLR